MDTIIALTNVDYVSVFVSVFVILIGLKAVVSILEWTSNKLGIEFKFVKNRKEDHELLVKTASELQKVKEEHEKNMKDIACYSTEEKNSIYQSIRDLKTEMENTKEEFYGKRDHDRKQSMEIQNDLKNAIGFLTEKVENLVNQIKNYELSDTRGKLLQAYRYYANKHTNPSMMWTEMESHAFWEQFKTYEALGGDDYMHTVVEPEMMKLTAIPLDDIEKVSIMMESRHQKN